MIMNAHTAVGIAQVVFYLPITAYAQYIGIRCWKYGSRMACYMIMAFTISTSRPSAQEQVSKGKRKKKKRLTLVAVRLAGGALVITVEQDLSESNADMIKATYILLNLGLVPLLASYDGFLSLVYVTSTSDMTSPHASGEASREADTDRDMIAPERTFPTTRCSAASTSSAPFSSCWPRGSSSAPAP